MVADLVPGPEGTRIEFYRSLLPQTAVGGRLLFETRTSAGGVDLWATDGTAPGTLRLRSLRESTSSTPAPQPGASIYGTPQVSCFAPVGKGLLLAADDGEHGLEPWHVDPRTGAAHLVADLAPGEAWSSPAPCARVGGVGVFAAITSEPFSDFASLVATSGAAGDATLLSDLPSAWGLWPKTYFADRLLLASAGIWATDGSPAATETLELLEESFEDLVPLGDRLLAAGSVLYVTDGTPGALLSLDPPTAEDLVYPHRLTRLGDRALFFGWQNSTGQELWSTDGTPEGTAPVVEIRPGAASAIPEGFPSPDRYLLSRLVPLDGAAYFAADDGVHGEELWRTDGTPGGTALAADLFPGPYPSVPRELARVGRWLFFSAESPTAGRELWATDGGSGAPILFDLQPGPGSSVPERLTAIGSHLYFSAWTPGHGREPWRLSAASDGPSSPSRIADIAPGPLSSSPLVFGNVGADVVTIANDNLTGFEPWKLRDPDVLFADDFESSGLELWDPKAP